MRVEIAKWAVKWYGTTPWDDLHEEQREIWMGEADELLALMEGDQQRPHIEDAVIDHIDRIEAENKRLLALLGGDREPVIDDLAHPGSRRDHPHEAGSTTPQETREGEWRCNDCGEPWDDSHALHGERELTPQEAEGEE